MRRRSRESVTGACMRLLTCLRSACDALLSSWLAPELREPSSVAKGSECSRHLSFSQARRSRQCVQCGRWSCRCVSSGISSFSFDQNCCEGREALESSVARKPGSQPFSTRSLEPKPQNSSVFSPAVVRTLLSSLKVRVAKGDPKDAGFADRLGTLP